MSEKHNPDRHGTSVVSFIGLPLVIGSALALVLLEVGRPYLLSQQLEKHLTPTASVRKMGDAPSKLPVGRMAEIGAVVAAMGLAGYHLFRTLSFEGHRSRAVKFRVGDGEIVIRKKTTDAEIEEQLRAVVHH